MNISISLLWVIVVGVYGRQFMKFQPEPPEERESPGAIESDIMLTHKQKVILKEIRIPGNRVKRKAIAYLTSRWPDGIVPYVISASSSPDTGVIMEAMRYWESLTCVHFVPYNISGGDARGHHARVRFIKGDGCYSYVGIIDFHNSQEISIGDGCAERGTVAHEIGHALGFWHEQSRPDRDDHVTIHFQNIEDGMESNFEKYGVDVVNTYSVKYDISSLMHYGSHYFSKNGHPTITPVNPLDMPKMGQRNYLSFYDVKLANMLYECNAQCADWLPECSGDGYIGPECTCVCHDGLVGRCEAPSECFTQSDGGDYRGAQNATSRGKSCQSWSDQRPYSHQFTPENFPNTGLGAHNYCRNPDRDIRPWCITTDSVISWDYCDVGLPSDKCDFRECYVKPDGLDYRGTVDTTVGGILCQKWSEQTPHTHEFSQVNYPNGGLGRHNYCRNPDYDGAPWCFTTNPDIRWQHCDVGRPTENCGLTECYEHENANDYRGVVSVTQTGYDCQDWTDVTSVSLNYDPENYPNAGLGDHNFCRNPDDKQQPWCFSTNPSIQWEYCDVGSYSDSCGYTECYVNEDASDYRGTVNATGDYQCMNWTEELPDNLGYNTQNFPLYDLDNHNYCRNPDGDSHAWCFTTDPKVEWVYCDVGISNFICD